MSCFLECFSNISFCCLSHPYRFRANSPGDSPGKFARPGPAQPELHKQLVSGQRAGEHAGGRGNVSRNEIKKCFILHFPKPCSFAREQADEQNRALSEKARLHLESYNFPVEMMVALPNGTVVNI